MVMSASAVTSLASDYLETWKIHTNNAKLLDQWARGEHELPKKPLKAGPEYEELQDATPTPWGRLIIGACAQALFAEVHRRADSAEASQTFKEVWKWNRMLGQQGAVYRAALAQNLSYVTTLPAKRPHVNTPSVRLLGQPATKMAAFYDTEGEDEFAAFAMWGERKKDSPKGDEYLSLRVYDHEAVYPLRCNIDGSEMQAGKPILHKVGVTPVHRFAPELDLDGRAVGQIQPFIPIIRRLDQDVYDRLIVQRFNSWRTRYIAGLEEPDTEMEKRAAAMRLRIEDLLVSTNADTKFGTLDPTDLEGYIKAHEADIRDLAAVSQTPPHHLLGQMANLSAEALAAAEASLMRKVDDIKISFGQSWDQVMRSSAFILARVAEENREAYLKEATDYDTEMRWADRESRSLSQAADALGKIAESLKIPVEMLWEQLPFWTKDDTERAKNLLKEAGAEDVLMQFLDQNAGGSNTDDKGDEQQKKAA